MISLFVQAACFIGIASLMAGLGYSALTWEYWVALCLGLGIGIGSYWDGFKKGKQS